MIILFRGAMPSGEPIEKWVSLAARGLMGAAQKVGQSKAVQAAAGAQAIRTVPGMVADKFGWGTDEEDAMRERTTAEHEEARTRQRQETQANVNTGGIHNAPQTPSTSSVMGVVGKGEPMDLAWELLKAKKKPFHGYNPKKHSRKGALSARGRAAAKRKTGANLKRPVTKKPSKLKPGGKAAKRRKSFCARMTGVKGPTSKEGKLTPKGAALKRWNC